MGDIKEMQAPAKERRLLILGAERQGCQKQQCSQSGESDSFHRIICLYQYEMAKTTLCLDGLPE